MRQTESADGPSGTRRTTSRLPASTMCSLLPHRQRVAARRPLFRHSRLVLPLATSRAPPPRLPSRRRCGRSARPVRSIRFTSRATRIDACSIDAPTPSPPRNTASIKPSTRAADMMLDIIRQEDEARAPPAKVAIPKGAILNPYDSEENLLSVAGPAKKSKPAPKKVGTFPSLCVYSAADPTSRQVASPKPKSPAPQPRQEKPKPAPPAISPLEQLERTMPAVR
ncbi:hypothetical protein AAT19DRAFT_16232 [Rhodotorula toruloides]|uniref:Uncharacterized protein n=1 Tax=Rhodotorula toruloides TaxID=5286 RepID=A0A2T0A643_RHOTO|nr:hypothetical protein AAT19DRAFT_16232 [Rhodotorula toruloides]